MAAKRRIVLCICCKNKEKCLPVFKKLFTFVHIRTSKTSVYEKLFHFALAIGFAGMCFIACAGYSAQDYVNDMKSLTEKTLKNASSYTEEDWKRVGEEYRSINEKGKKVLEDMTEDQRKELEKFSEEVSEKAAEFNHEELKQQFDDLMQQADGFINDMLEEIKDKE